jgi:hypothetical protein
MTVNVQEQAMVVPYMLASQRPVGKGGSESYAGARLAPRHRPNRGTGDLG